MGGKMAKCDTRHGFTLVEILVAMAVFSILLTLMVQFFSSARTLWTANEKRTSVYADASIALDLMSNLLQTTFPFIEEKTPPEVSVNQTPFIIKAEDPSPAGDRGNHRIVFISNSAMPLSKGGSIRYLCFQRGDDPNNPGKNNVLYLKIFSDTDTDFAACIPDFTLDKPGYASGVTGVRNFIYDIMCSPDSMKIRADFVPTAADAKSDHVKPILRNVIGLKFTPIRMKMKEEPTGSGAWYGEGVDKVTAIPSTGYTGIPGAGDEKKWCLAGIEIELVLMPDEAAVFNWSGADDDYRKRNEYTFRRTVWLGQRMCVK